MAVLLTNLSVLISRPRWEFRKKTWPRGNKNTHPAKEMSNEDDQSLLDIGIASVETLELVRFPVSIKDRMIGDFFKVCL